MKTIFEYKIPNSDLSGSWGEDVCRHFTHAGCIDICLLHRLYNSRISVVPLNFNDKNISVAPWTDSWEQPGGGGVPCLPQRSWTPWPQRAGGGFWILNLMILIRYAPKKRIFPKYYERLSLRVECSCSQLGRPKAWRLYICNSQYHNIIMILSQYHNNNAQYHNFTNDNITTKSQLHNDNITIVMHNNINIS